MGLRGLPEVRARKVALVLVQRNPGKPISAATRYSLPHRGLPTVASNHASRSLARPFRAHRRTTPERTRIRCRDCSVPLGLHPPGLPSPTAHEESRIRLTCTLRRTSPGLATRDAGVPHLPPSGPSVSHALAGFHPATPFRACFIPVTLLGFRLQGFGPPPGGRTSLEAACSLAVRSAREAGQLRARIAASEP